MKRHLREQAEKIKEKLQVYERTRSEHRRRRLRQGFTTIGIVGYTNAGKSTLFNTLTKKSVLAEDKLFATLGTSVGKVYVASEDGRGTEFLVNDTVGFIRDLPPELIAAFSSTLEDSIESTLLLHVVDAGDLDMIRKMAVVDETLAKIGATQSRKIVFNKCDQIDLGRRMELMTSFPDALFVSAVSGEGVEELKRAILTQI